MPVPAEIEEGLEFYKVDPALRDLIARVSAVRSLTADGPGVGYVAVRPAAWGTVSAYFHTSYVDIALEPYQAQRLHRDRGWKLVKINGSTGFVRLESAMLGDEVAAAEAASLLVSAVDKSEVGTAYEGGNRGATAPVASVEKCPRCGVDKLGGHCDRCD